MKSSALITLREGKNIEDLKKILPLKDVISIESLFGRTVLVKFNRVLASEERRQLRAKHNDVIENIDSGRPAIPL